MPVLSTVANEKDCLQKEWRYEYILSEVTYKSLLSLAQVVKQHLTQNQSHLPNTLLE